MPQPGEILGDRYRLDDRIGAGGMGEVWQATDTVLGRDVAVKTLHAGRAGDSGFQTRFRHEARAMAVLHHPGVADVYDYGQSGPDAYIVMAHVQGEALNQRIAARGRLSPAETMSIVAQAGRALEAAHQAGIVHRDVKPGNLIIRPDGTVVLVDFGVARSAESAALTGAKEVVGTALYIAPEQVSKDITGPKADVYALGVVAYHCLAGHPPFLGDSPIAVALQHLSDEPPPLPADVPAQVRAVVETAMAKDPDDRFSSAAAMAEAADLASAGTGTTAILAATSSFAAAGETATGETAASETAASETAASETATGGTAAGRARSAVPVPAPLRTPGGDTAEFPAVPGGRRRALLLSVAGLVVLGTAAAVLALFNPGILGGSTPSSIPTSGAPASAGSAAPAVKETKKGRTTQQQNAATSKPAAPVRTTTPTPSQTPSTSTTTTSAPEETTTAPEQTATTTGNSGPGGGDGSGGGNEGEGGGEAAATTPAAGLAAG